MGISLQKQTGEELILPVQRKIRVNGSETSGTRDTNSEVERNLFEVKNIFIFPREGTYELCYCVGASNWNRARCLSGSNQSRGREEFPVEWRSERTKGATVQTEELIQQIVELSYECVVSEDTIYNRNVIETNNTD